jgi:predicted nucleotidyltransferase
MFKQKQKRETIYTSFPTLTHTNDDALFTVHSNDQNMLRMRTYIMYVYIKDSPKGSKRKTIIRKKRKSNDRHKNKNSNIYIIANVCEFRKTKNI